MVPSEDRLVASWDGRGELVSGPLLGVRMIERFLTTGADLAVPRDSDADLGCDGVAEGLRW